ncbi:acetyl-CoA acetyltransferase [Sphingopyxis terrae subsp. terrae NBRC 15098]|uniref:Acetyl-CoA acetyltransferase n=1 Tax=Sphingopyxis terrae subsp. terrae NBRC 15098 TaxID=1219058 RepID=A0A142VZK3_9SPHN|nr:acetyl-CoA acetyltransferase [Sphingopyxis terrae]AMU95214.1 acetyl-CoA acetyltransferase [Sphingopyxis terrae subsp. terrae NBRC 15098]
MTMTDPERIPVIIGVGQVNDRPADPDEGLDSLGLMVAALRVAAEDAGVPLAEIDSLAIVDQISFHSLGKLPEPLAAAIGASPAINYQSAAPHGDTPVRLLNEAANRIGAGEVKLAAIVGAEALRTAAGRAAKAASGEDKSYNAIRKVATRHEPDYAQKHGLAAPVDVYPLYENATRAAWGQSLAEAQDESAEIWSRFSEVAAENEGAWIRKPATPADILRVDERNRPIAFPYSKLMVANSSVNQGAGFLVASLAEARRRGIPEDRLIYVGMGAAAKEPPSILRRDRYNGSVSMETSINRTLALNGMTAQDFDFVELYSCFPCVPKMARRTLGWPVDRPATVFGGLTFGGGPIANYMSHAIVSMVDKLRRDGRYGFLFANGGFATDNHCIVLGKEPIAAASFPQDFDYQAEAEAKRGPVPDLVEDYTGPATIESYTIFYGRDGAPRAGVVVARTPAGERTLAHVDVEDATMLAILTDGKAEPVGAAGQIVALDEGFGWRAG